MYRYIKYVSSDIKICLLLKFKSEYPPAFSCKLFLTTKGITNLEGVHYQVNSGTFRHYESNGEKTGIREEPILSYNMEWTARGEHRKWGMILCSFVINYKGKESTDSNNKDSKTWL